MKSYEELNQSIQMEKERTGQKEILSSGKRSYVKKNSKEDIRNKKSEFKKVKSEQPSLKNREIFKIIGVTSKSLQSSILKSISREVVVSQQV